MLTVAEVSVQKNKLGQVSSPISNSRFSDFEKALNDIFLKELNSSDSIFIHISPNVVKKAALFLSGMAFRPAAIGVCGETASGKSTIVLDSMEMIKDFACELSLGDIVTRINTDDYYYDRSAEVKKAGSFEHFAKTYDLDVPEAIELSLMKKHIQKLLSHQEVFLPKYDMSGTAIRFDNYKLAKPSPVIIAEGIYTLIDGVSDVFDFKIYVDIDKNIQKERFFERASQRGLGSSAQNIFENASQKALIYIYPCKNNADIILNGKTSREKYRVFVNSILTLLEKNYYNFAI